MGAMSSCFGSGEKRPQPELRVARTQSRSNGGNALAYRCVLGAFLSPSTQPRACAAEIVSLLQDIARLTPHSDNYKPPSTDTASGLYRATSRPQPT